MTYGLEARGEPRMGGLLQRLAEGAAPGLVNEALVAARAEVKAILQRELVSHLLEQVAGDAFSEPAAAGQVPTAAEPDRPEVRPDLGTPDLSAPTGTGPGEPGLVGGRSVGSITPRSDRGRGKGAHRGSSCYLYGITDADPDRVRGLPGVDGSSTETVRDDKLVAVVSPIDVDSAAWRAVGADAPDLGTLAPLLRSHERVLEDLLDAGPVVPVRFGLTFSDRRAIRDLLRINGPAIHAALDRVRGSAEWGLSVWWDVRLVKGGLDRTVSPDLVGAAGRQASPGRRYLDQRRADRQNTERLAAVRSHIAAGLHERLAQLGNGALTHRPDTRRSADRPGGEPLLKASYLVGHDHAEQFRVTIEHELAAGREWGLSGELTGPWPAYHFVALDTAELGT